MQSRGTAGGLGGGAGPGVSGPRSTELEFADAIKLYDQYLARLKIDMDAQVHIVSNLDRRQTELFGTLHTLLSDFKKVKAEAESVFRDIRKTQNEHSEALRRLRTLENMARMIKLSADMEPAESGSADALPTGWATRGPVQPAVGRKQSMSLGQNRFTASASSSTPPATAPSVPLAGSSLAGTSSPSIGPKRIGVRAVEAKAVPRSKGELGGSTMGIADGPLRSQPTFIGSSGVQPTVIGTGRKPVNKAQPVPLEPLKASAASSLISAASPSASPSPMGAALPAASMGDSEEGSSARVLHRSGNAASVRPDPPLRRSYAVAPVQDEPLPQPKQPEMPSRRLKPALKPRTTNPAAVQPAPEPVVEEEPPDLSEEMNSYAAQLWQSGPTAASVTPPRTLMEEELDLSQEMADYGASMWSCLQPSSDNGKARVDDGDVDLAAISSEMQNYAAQMWNQPGPVVASHDVVLSEVDQLVHHLQQQSRRMKGSAASAEPASPTPHVQRTAHASIAFDPEVLHEMQAYASSLWSTGPPQSSGNHWVVPTLK